MGFAKRPIRVAYFVANYHRFAGAQRSLFHLVCGLDRDVVDPLVVTAGEGPLPQHFRERGIPVEIVEPPRAIQAFGGALQRIGNATRARLLATAVLPYSLRLARSFRRARTDIVHFNDSRALLMGGIGALAACNPAIWHVRGDASELGALLLNACGLLADAIITVADGIRGCIPPRFRGRCVTVYNGIDVRQDAPGRDRRALLASTQPALDIGPEVPLVVVLSTVIPLKGAHHVLDAVRLLRGRATTPGPAVVFVGDRPDADYARYLDRRVAEEGLGLVRFAGWDGEPSDWLSAADIVVLSTVAREELEIEGRRRVVAGGEGFPRAVLEAMAAGRAIVATRVGGVPEQIENDQEGLLVEPSDPAALAAAIERLARDPALRARIGDAARRYVAARFSVRAMVDGTVAVYRRLLGPPESG